MDCFKIFFRKQPRRTEKNRENLKPEWPLPHLDMNLELPEHVLVALLNLLLILLIIPTCL